MWPNDTRIPDIDYIVGLDLAQGGADWTALCVLQRTVPVYGGPAEYTVIWLQRWRDRRTAKIPERVAEVERQLGAIHRDREFERVGRLSPFTPPVPWRLAVDITGVSGFGADPLRQAGFEDVLEPIKIHGGDAVSRGEDGSHRVPKRNIAGAIDVLLEQGRLKIVESLPDAGVLKAELENFRVRITTTGHDTYEAGPTEMWRAGAHDDMVLSVGIALWLGEAYPPLGPIDPAILKAFSNMPGW